MSNATYNTAKKLHESTSITEGRNGKVPKKLQRHITQAQWDKLPKHLARRRRDWAKSADQDMIDTMAAQRKKAKKSRQSRKKLGKQVVPDVIKAMNLDKVQQAAEKVLQKKIKELGLPPKEAKWVFKSLKQSFTGFKRDAAYELEQSVGDAVEAMQEEA